MFLAEGTPEGGSVCLRLTFAHMVNLYTHHTEYTTLSKVRSIMTGKPVSLMEKD
ncbi:hypothetical protein [Bacteroides acidifaciens]|uniref:hypothetical protein n=1 Tax=Bacteroides acidifaciens TaxID=85831 RepID=UPI0025B4867C|nr:hypothetical protein [Bacteroides acidifaciens]